MHEETHRTKSTGSGTKSRPPGRSALSSQALCSRVCPGLLLGSAGQAACPAASGHRAALCIYLGEVSGLEPRCRWQGCSRKDAGVGGGAQRPRGPWLGVVSAPWTEPLPGLLLSLLPSRPPPSLPPSLSLKSKLERHEQWSQADPGTSPPPCVIVGKPPGSPRHITERV